MCVGKVFFFNKRKPTQKTPKKKKTPPPPPPQNVSQGKMYLSKSKTATTNKSLLNLNHHYNVKKTPQA